MKKFKSLFLVAAAVLIGFSSCNNEESFDDGYRAFSIQVTGVSESRALQTTGQGVIATIASAGTDGVVFLIAPDNSVIQATALTAAAQGVAPGQNLGTHPSNTRVFVVANVTTVYGVGATTALMAANSWTAIQAILQTTASYANATALNPILSNNSGLPASAVVVSPTLARATIELSPVTARLELGQVTGGTWQDPNVAANRDRILGFTVAGVYVDGYFTSFNYAGVGSGAIRAQGTSTDFTGVLGDVGPWAANAANWATSTPASAAPPAAVPQIWWAYNVPAGTISRLIIAVTNVTYEKSTDGGATWVPGITKDPTFTYYLTVSSYVNPVGGAVWTQDFLRGYVYQVGNLTFNRLNLHGTPNPTDLDLEVLVSVRPWQFQALNANLY